MPLEWVASLAQSGRGLWVLPIMGSRRSVTGDKVGCAAEMFGNHWAKGTRVYGTRVKMESSSVDIRQCLMNFSNS